VLRYHCQENYFVTNFGDSDTREDIPQLCDGYEQEVIRELNLRASGISTVIWATGYVFDFSLGETARTRRRWLHGPDTRTDPVRRFIFPGYAVVATAAGPESCLGWEMTLPALPAHIAMRERQEVEAAV